MNRTNGLNKWIIALCWAAMGAAGSPQAVAQSPVSLDSCYVWAQRNYPLIRKTELIAQTEAYSLENIAKGFLPQIALNGQATYQSAVTQIAIPGMNIKPLSKDQYKLYVDVNQTLYDGGTIRAQQAAQRAASAMDSAALHKDLFLLRERVNQLFFGALLLNAQLQQLNVMISELKETQKRVEGAISGGVAYKSDLAQLQAEILTQGQRVIEIEAGMANYLKLLEFFIGKNIPSVAQLQVPATAKAATEKANNRPELRLLSLQKSLYERQLRVFDTYKMPRISAFGQGGYARPALNILNNSFDWYYIGGLRVNWNIAALYSLRTDRMLLQTKIQQVEIDKDVFLFQQNLNVLQQDAEAVKLNALLDSDREIIRLKETVKEAAKAKYDNGTITLNDYLKEIDAVSRATFNESLHRLQVLASAANQRFLLGN